MKYSIRKSRISDCDDIAHIVTLCWQDTYKGIVNDDFLNNLSNNEKVRVDSMKESFNKDDNHEYVLLVNKKIVGFVKVVFTSENVNDCGEIQAIYILKDYRGSGFGRKLFEKAVLELKRMGCKTMLIGCLDGNISNDFYLHMDGKLIKNRTFSLPNQDLLENVYYYDIQ